MPAALAEWGEANYLPSRLRAFAPSREPALP